MQTPTPSLPQRLPAVLLLLLLLLTSAAAWAQPSVTGFSPTSGASGSSVVITGSGFTGATSVRFGELSAVFTVNSATQITATVPRAASTQLINVTTSAGYGLSASAFAVTRGSSVSYSLVANNFAGVSGGNVAPAVADLDGDGRLDLLVGELDGTIGRYEQTAVNGSVFSFLGLLNTGSATIDMGIQATVAIVDLEGNGRYNLVLGRGDGTVSEYEQTSVGAATFGFVQDNLSGISTPSNTATSMTDLDGDGYLELLVGKGDGITSHSEQRLGNINTDVFDRVDTNFNQLQLSGNAAPFCVDLDGNGRIDILMGVSTGAIYRYEQNAVGSFTVSQLSSNFNSISAGNNAKPCVTDIDGDGLLDLLVGRSDGTISRYEQAGTVPAPTITSFTPTSGPVGTTVTVTGTNLGGASAVTVNGTAGTITGTPTATSFTFTVGSGSGTGPIGVTTPGGSASSSGSFTVGSNTAPTDISLSNASVAENQPLNTTVGSFSTTDAQGGTFTYTFAVGGADNGSFNISGTALTTNGSFDFETKSSYSVKIRSTDAGGLFFEKTFTISVTDVAEVPTVTSFTPTSGTVGTSGIVITGSNFTSAGAVTVRFNGTTATTVTVNSNSQLTATVPAGATTGTISVQNADGTGTSTGSFTVTTLATVTTATPTTVTASSAVLGGSVTSGTALTERGVVYVAGNGTPTTSDTKALTGTSTGSFSGTVSGLAGNTLYSVRAYATNGAGTAYGAVQTFTTGNNPPVAGDDSYTVAEDSGANAFSVLGNDTDPDAGTTLRITGVTQPANGSVTFTGTGVSFTPTLNFNGTTSFTYNISDGDGGTDTGTVTVTVTAVNDAPVVTVPGTQSTPEDTHLAFSSGAGNAITVSDVDAGSGQLEIYLGATQGAVSLSSFSGLTFTAGDGTADASMTFRGTLSSINAALNNMAFYPNTGYSGAAALQVQANDLGNTGSGGAKSDSKTVTINVTAVNDAPVLVASSGSTAFTAGSGAVAVDGGLTASDSDNTTLASGTVSVTTGFVSGQDVLAFSNTSSATFGNIAGSYASGTGVLTLTSSGATATVAQWQAALRAITYNNTSTPPTGTSRVVSFRVNDGTTNSNTVTKTITLTVPAPVVSSLTPSSGPVGTSVVVAGSNFTGATAVSFNGTAASSYVVNSGSQITAVVAAGTTTGPFTVTTPYGVSNNNGTFTVTAATTSTTLTSSANPSVFGQSVTFTATVTNTNGSATPTGTVTFKDGATTIGTGTLNGSGVATFSTSTLSVATHTISAVYGAATGFSASTSGNLSQVVNAAGTTTTLTSSANPSVFGQGIYLNASVSTVAPGSGIATGTVTFKEGATTLGTVAVAASGNASLLISTLSVGSHAIVATYAATTNYGASTSNTLTQVVNNAATSTTLSSSANPSTFGQSVTFTATVAVTSPGAGTVAGTVTFKDGSTTLGTGTISGSTATFNTSALSQGSHSITAVYGGTTGLAASTSAVLTQVVNAPPAPAITSLSPTSGPVGTSVTISGSNLAGTTSVSFDGVAQTTITGNTGTSLTVNVPAGVALGATDVVVTTPSGSSNTSTFTVTPPAPVVTSVAAPANGTYRIGQFVTFLVSFDQPVTVSTAGGTPVILMTVGSTPRGVTYLSGSNTNTLTFRYLVQAGDLDTDGVTLGNSIAPNNGTLRNATGTDVVPTLNNVSPLTGVLVDGVAPTATVATTGANPTSSSLIPITITFSEAVTGLTAANIVVTNGTKGTLSGSGTTYTLNVTATASGAVTVQVNASAAQDAAGNPNAASNTLSVTYNPPPVSIASFTPTNGSVGTVVTITGSGFTGATAVTINNVAVASYTVDSNTQITATVSASNTTGLIRVTTGAGTGTSSTNFVVGPAITGVTATSNGTYRVGQTLTFSVAFSQAVTVVTTGGTPTVALTVGSTVRNVPYASGSGSSTLQFRYVIVAGDLDTDGVTLSGTGIDLNGGTIRNSSGVNADLDFDNVADTSGLLVDGVAPTVAISSPAGSSTPTSPIPVTISFSEPVTNFTTAGITVTNGSKGTLSGSGTTYTINITPTAAGAVTVNVAANSAQDAATNGNVAAPQFSITYAPLPTITNFSPANGPVGTSVTITGTNFTGATAVAFNGLAAASFTVNSATSITAVVPVGVTAGKISVTTPSGTVLSPSNFLPTAPAVLSVAVPANDTYGVGQNLDFSVLYDQVVNVTGSPYLTLTVGSTARNVAYVSGSGSRTLLFRYVVAAGETDNNGVALGGSINPGTGTIRNAGNSSATFTLNSVAPTTGVLVDGVVPTVALSSTATSPTNTSPIPLTITFSEPVTGLTLAALTVTNGTASNLGGSGRTYTVDITPAADGAVTVNLPAASAQDVAGNDNTAAPQFSITYAAPTVLISTLSPNSGPVGTSVTIGGSNFTGATSVTFNGTTAAFTVVSNTQITTTVPAGASTGNVVVTAPIGTSNGVNFTVTLPATTTTLTSSLNPAVTGQTVTFTATVTTAAGTPTGTVTFSDNGTPLGTGTLNGSGVATFSTSSLAGGSHPITAVYGGSGSLAGSTSATLTQVVNAPAGPTITTLTPNSGAVGTSVTIAGSNLGGATSVSFNGTDQTTITANSATSLTVAVPAGATTGLVTVTTPNGVSNGLTFTVVNTAPTVTSLSAAAELPGMPVVITGTGFTSGSTVSFGGTAASSVTFTSATSLTAVVPAGATVGSSPIVVTTNGTSSTSAPAFSVLKVYDAVASCLSTVPYATTGDGAWHYLLASNGQVVAALQDTRAALGSVSLDFLTTGTAGAVRQDARGHAYLDRNWHLTATNSTFTGSSVNVRFYGLVSEFTRLQAADASVTYATLKATQYSGPNEDCQLGNNNSAAGEARTLSLTASTPGNGVAWFVAEASVPDHFSEFYLTGSSTPLPVELTAFTAEAEGAAVRLSWRTASEKNSALFEIERSLDGKAFARIGEVAAQGSKTSLTDYTFRDGQTPKSPTLVYYRLRQVDLDGTASYSLVRAVTVGPAALALYPNPAHGGPATLTGAAPGTTVAVFDAVGRLVTQATAEADGTARLSLPTGLATGVYVVRGGNHTLRLVVE
ncbi:Ig-like domain repeat protein [Hymenobacter sp. M29]|uniref:Ig-like domain repeat protein n=1 Tax=Hymenobacter mellowenesis TaxID=3063995 RepID=A0ABT9A775_9BACT|nr:Ig-like domain repeat protein [Hymenobacter sp. M29]MDO7845075.1 Ig-like domain repeat protein [Hymenobacter sp. M29]